MQSRTAGGAEHTKQAAPRTESAGACIVPKPLHRLLRRCLPKGRAAAETVHVLPIVISSHVKVPKMEMLPPLKLPRSSPPNQRTLPLMPACRGVDRSCYRHCAPSANGGTLMRVSPTPSSTARRLLSTRWRRAAAAIERRNSPAAGHIQWSPRYRASARTPTADEVAAVPLDHQRQGGGASHGWTAAAQGQPPSGGADAARAAGRGLSGCRRRGGGAPHGWIAVAQSRRRGWRRRAAAAP